jgi:arylsulfatase A-like enzyme
MVSLFLVVSGLFLACESQPAPAPPPGAPEASAPDVLVVVLDTVRSDKLSTYGYRQPTSPQLDAVAAAGVTFEDVTAPGSWTWSSHASLFTGVGPWEHGAHVSLSAKGVDAGQGNWGIQAMRTDLDTLAQRFAEAGYRTASLSANRFLDPALGLTRGFEIAEVMKDDALPARAEAIMNDSSDKRPLFLFVNILVAHAPWEVFPAPWSQRHEPRLSDASRAPTWSAPFLMDEPAGIDLLRSTGTPALSGHKQLITGRLKIPDPDMELIEDLYTGGITAADFLLHKILKPWTASRPSAVVAVTSDHGEYLGEHGLWDHGLTVFSQVVDVPLVIAAPGRLPKGARVSTPVQMHDLYGTLLDLAGLSFDDKVSLVPVVQGGPRPGPIQAKAWASRSWSESVGGIFSEDWSLYREGDWALIHSSGGSNRLYRVDLDRGMTEDVSARYPEQYKRLVEASLSSFPDATETTPVLDLAPEMVQELQALGYLDP